MTVINNLPKLVLFCFVVALIKGYFFIGYATGLEVFIKLLVFPLIISYFVVIFALEYTKWGFVSTMLFISGVIFLSEVLSHIFYFFETGVSIFNDFESGSVGMFIIFLHITIGVFVVLSKKNDFDRRKN